MPEVSCWHCGYPLPTEGDRLGRYAGIPISRTGYRDADGVQRSRYSIYGYFHDPQCARAWLEEHPRCQRFRPLFRSYVEDVWGMQVPPPAMSKVLLEAYGGALSWPAWKAASMRSQRAWRLTEAAQQAGEGMGRALLDRSQVVAPAESLRVDPEAELNQPGRSTGLDWLVEW